MGEELDRLEAMIADEHGTWDLSRRDERAIAWAIDQIKAARTPGPATGSDVAARAAYEARTRGLHEIGSWPAFRDGYAAGLAARTPDVSRLLAAAKEAMAHWDIGEDPHWVLAGIADAIAEHEAATKGDGG